MARKAVRGDSTNYRHHLWLRLMLARVAGNEAEVEASLWQAVKLGEDRAEAWVALVRHLVQAGKKDEARELVGKAREKLAGRGAEQALAQCYETTGDLGEARKLHAQARTARPNDTGVLETAAQFYLRAGDTDEAKRCLEGILGRSKRDDPAAVQARRLLALLVYAQGSHEEKQRALAMMGILDPAADGAACRELPAEQVRTQAALLAVQWKKSDRLRAIRLLEGLAARQPLAADDQMLLGRLHDSVGNWPEARRRMSVVLADHGENPVYLATFIESLLRRQDWRAAEGWLKRPEAKQPTALQTVRLKAESLRLQGATDRAVAVVKGYADAAGANLFGAAG